MDESVEVTPSLGKWDYGWWRRIPIQCAPGPDVSPLAFMGRQYLDWMVSHNDALAASSWLLHLALTAASTFRTVSGPVITEIMCRRPWQRGLLRMSSRKTHRKRSARRMNVGAFECVASPPLLNISRRIRASGVQE